MTRALTDPPRTAGPRQPHRCLAWLACALFLPPALAATSPPATDERVQPGCGAEPLPTQAAREAVGFVERTVHEAHVDGPERDQPALRQLQALGQSIHEPIAPAALALAINRALGLAGDAHLRVELSPQAAATCNTLPIEFEWGDQGLLVTSQGGSVPTGSRVSSIGQRSLRDLESFARHHIPHENAYWARSEFARLVTREDWARAAGLADTGGSVDVTYTSPAGAVGRTTLTFDRAARATRPWVGFQIYAGQSTGLLWMDRCEPDEEFQRTLDAFVVAVRNANVRKVAIDLRRNPGGDAGAALAVLRAFGLSAAQGFSVETRVSATLVATMPMLAPSSLAPVFEGAGLPTPAADAERYEIPAPLVLALVQSRLGERAFETAPDRQLFLLTGGATFSSAALFTLLVRDNALGLVIGEPIGNAASFNGSEVILAVPGMPHELHVSTAHLARPDGLAGLAPTVLPDVLAPATMHSLAQGTDPALDFVLHAPSARKKR
jgi:hypothetical protein